MFDKPIVMIDFETSGMSPDQGGRVTEVAALRIVGGEVVDRYVSLINCNVRIPSFITQLTGITQSMVNKAPPVSEVMPALVEFIGDATLAAHNASFDEKFLLAESDRLRLAPRHDGVVCSVKLSRRVFPGLDSYSLGPLASSLGIRFKGQAHRAEADAEVASALLLRIGEHLGERYGITPVDPRLLQQVNKLSAAKVASFLQKQPLLKAAANPAQATLPVALPSKAVQRYRHYKGGIYELVCEATQESDLSPVIVYKAHNGTYWTRPKSVFFEMLEVDGQMVQRFAPIAD
jgi:DNA polymerase-3 subunit epsilon